MLLILKFIKLFIKHFAYSFILFIFAANLILYIMIKQKLISAKIDSTQLELFDKVCVNLGVKRNTLLNFLVWYANNALDLKVYGMIAAYQRCLVEFEKE